MLSNPASMATPRDSSNSQSSTIPGSPWFAVTRSGISSHASTVLKRSLGSPTIAADVVKEIGLSGQIARIARRTLAHAAPLESPGLRRRTHGHAPTERQRPRLREPLRRSQLDYAVLLGEPGRRSARPARRRWSACSLGAPAENTRSLVPIVATTELAVLSTNSTP